MAHQTSAKVTAPGTLVTMRAGGALDGTVTIALTAEGRLQVEAAWNAGGSSRSAVRAIDGHFTARTLASEWADALAAGREPVTA
ncbi:MAG: hypothetical protein ABR947_06225 [Solirubrobacteraceae bacterium]